MFGVNKGCRLIYSYIFSTSTSPRKSFQTEELTQSLTQDFIKKVQSKADIGDESKYSPNNEALT